MRLTNYTDYALRVLIYTATAGESVTISRISAAFGISKEHLRKVVHTLAQLGYLTTSQGRHGGIQLAKPPAEINIRDVIELFETSTLVECFDPATNRCQISDMCMLRHVLLKARTNFMETLGAYHLSDFVRNPKLIAFSRTG